MKINELINSFEIWTSKEESELLEKLKKPIKLSHLNEHDKVNVQNMIRKSLVTKIGFDDPSVVANEN